jgi:hypothetical protein
MISAENRFANGGSTHPARRFYVVVVCIWLYQTPTPYSRPRFLDFSLDKLPVEVQWREK